MKPSVYLETSIISYMAAWPSRDLIVAAQQEATRLWWGEKRANFESVVSEAVRRECSAGDADAARRRLELLQSIRAVRLSDAALALAKSLVAGAGLPRRAAVDALHVAAAGANGIEYLLTWNCAHIASGVYRPRLESICRALGHRPPTICTPHELM